MHLNPLSGRRRQNAAVGLVFAVVAVGIALVRFRCSPLYPRLNDVNSDLYVYQLIGNSWARGRLPYRDVYDVKGPFLYLLFAAFARVRPWSMAPPLAVLTLLAFASLWLADAIARQHLASRGLSAVAAVGSCLLTYLSVVGVTSSFTCEELAVPGVLLLLWLLLRWSRDPDGVASGWWLLDGLVLAALFWSKYQVVAPWLAVLAALTIRVRGQLPASALRRVLGLHLAAACVATVAILACYAPELPTMLRAYFLAKRDLLAPGEELRAEGDFVVQALTQNAAAALTLVAVLVVLLGAARGRRTGPPLALAFGLSLWASVAFVRHPNNLFVPLTFCATAVPQLLSAAASRRPAIARAGGALVTLAAAAACVAPLLQGFADEGLFRHPKPLTCYRLPGLARERTDVRVSTLFATTAGQPILSVGTLFAARSSYVSHLPGAHRFELVDSSWSSNIGADRVQAHYLEQRTFAYAWVHINRLDPFHDLPAQLATATYTDGASQPEQAAALVSNYLPLLACNNELLLRARLPAR